MSATEGIIWKAEYRNQFNSNWTQACDPFDSQEAAERWLEEELEVPNDLRTELRIVAVTTTVTTTVIGEGVIEARPVTR